MYHLDSGERINKEAAGTVRRSLLGYRMEINFEECAILSPSATSYTFTKPRPGQSYAFMLSAVTTANNMLKERRAKVIILVKKTFGKGSRLTDYDYV